MNYTFPGFGAGELSETLQGRADLSALKYGCSLFRNMIPTRIGGAYQRPGFMKRGLADTQLDADRVNLIPFVATSAEAYVIEAGPFYFRFWRNETIVLTNAANVGKPGVVSVAGDPLKIATPYDLSSLFELQYAHANDVLWLAHPDFPPQKLERYALDQFQFSEMAFIFPPVRDQNVDEITLAVTGDLEVGGSVTITAVGGDVFLDPDDIGTYYAIDHRRATPSVEISLSLGSGTASAILVFSGNAVAAETFSIGTGVNLRTYTWSAAASAPYQITIGGTVDASIENALKAINVPASGGATPGTLAHPSVTASNLGIFAGGVKASNSLFFTDNNLTAGSTPDGFSIGAHSYRFSNDVTSGPPNRVKVGATLADSIANAILAITATGAAGTNYTAGTAANTDVASDPAAIGSSLRVQALAAGIAGNAITTTVDHTSRLSWTTPTLTGGADAATNQMQVTARLEGEIGNDIEVSETMTNAVWNPLHSLTGGSDNTNYDPANPDAVIPTVRVTGTWEVYTLGRWYGTLTLQQQRSTGEWEVVRTWDSQNDRNVQATGTVDGEKTMRLTFVGAGIADDDAPARAVLTAVDAIVHGLVLITGVTSPTIATGTVIKPIWSSEPTYLWARGSWGNRYGYPSAVVLHQQRLVFGQGSRIIGSQTGGFDNFFRGELADDSYQFELAATVQQNIVSLQSQRGLIILTDTNEWLADGGTEGAVITPASFRTEQLSGYGSDLGPSQMIHNNVLFIQRGRRTLNEYIFQFANQNYEATDLTELVETLTEELITQVIWAQVPHSLMMCVTEAGSLLIMGYRRTQGAAGEGGQLAWSKHTTPHGIIESVCAIPGSNGITDVWACIKRALPGGGVVRTIESWDLLYWPRLAVRTTEFVPELVSLDGAVRYSGVLPASPTLTGLDHLEGLTAGIMIAGCRLPDQEVIGGQIVLDPDQMPTDPSTVVAGLIVTAQLQPFLTVVQLKEGLSEGKMKRIAKINPRFYQTGACSFADAAGATVRTMDFRKPSDPVNQPVPLFTGMRDSVDLAGGWRVDTLFYFVNESVLPMNLLSVTTEITIVG